MKYVATIHSSNHIGEKTEKFEAISDREAISICEHRWPNTIMCLHRNNTELGKPQYTEVKDFLKGKCHCGENSYHDSIRGLCEKHHRELLDKQNAEYFSKI